MLRSQGGRWAAGARDSSWGAVAAGLLVRGIPPGARWPLGCWCAGFLLGRGECWGAGARDSSWGAVSAGLLVRGIPPGACTIFLYFSVRGACWAVDTRGFRWGAGCWLRVGAQESCVGAAAAGPRGRENSAGAQQRVGENDPEIVPKTRFTAHENLVYARMSCRPSCAFCIRGILADTLVVSVYIFYSISLCALHQFSPCCGDARIPLTSGKMHEKHSSV